MNRLNTENNANNRISRQLCYTKQLKVLCRRKKCGVGNEGPIKHINLTTVKSFRTTSSLVETDYSLLKSKNMKNILPQLFLIIPSTIKTCKGTTVAISHNPFNYTNHGIHSFLNYLNNRDCSVVRWQEERYVRSEYDILQ